MKKLLFVFCIILSIFILRHANALCINTEKANVRIGPGTNYEVIWEVHKYMPFLKVGVSLSGEWYAVKDVDGDVNWIHRRLLTNKYKCTVVKTDNVNVRTGPGTKYPKSSLSPAKKYYSFKVLKRKGAWIRVKDEWGGIGWIKRNYLWIK